MKAKELMVGDWIQALCENYEPYEVVLEKSQITHINRETIYVANGNIFYGEDGEMRRYSVAEPIPLTDEILEKNGFSTTDEKYYYIEETENKFGYSFAIRRNRTGLFCIVCDQVVILEYVHQIQHLLRLCGFNDMANNIKVE